MTARGPIGPVTVVVADHDSLARMALAQVLSTRELALVGEAASGQAAIRLVADLRPDVVLIDLTLPGAGTTGVDVIERLGVLAPASRVLVLTASDQNRVVEAIVAGASGYILKSAGAAEIADAVIATAAGETVLSSRVAGKLLQRIRERDIPATATSEDAALAIRGALTARELEIFSRLASGESNHDIGRALSLSENTVSNHIASILAKLRLRNRIQAAVHAVRCGLS